MKVLLLRIVATALLLACLWPEPSRYAAEWTLRDAGARVERVLRGLDTGSAAQTSMAVVGTTTDSVSATMPDDTRAALLGGIALILQNRAPEAVTMLDAAIARGERPELTLNLGRARTAAGDTAGADAAYLRTAWASPLALNTLPAAMRTELLQRVTVLEDALHDDTLHAPPPLDGEKEQAD